MEGAAFTDVFPRFRGELLIDGRTNFLGWIGVAEGPQTNGVGKKRDAVAPNQSWYGVQNDWTGARGTSPDTSWNDTSGAVVD